MKWEIDTGKCMIIAEAGVNHNGDLATALKLCDAVKKSGADVIKFQTWKTENIITKSVEQADYQVANTHVRESQFDMLKRLELSYEDFKKIKQYCDSIGLEFTSTADDEESLDFLVDLGVPFLKVGSGDINNVPFLRTIGKKGMPVILSTGMSELSDVEYSVGILKECGTSNIALLHCTTNYPCPFKEVNLRAIHTLRDAFHMPVGYSDHTLGIEIPVAAVAMGARIIEKHFTLDKKMNGPDHAASTEPEKFTEMVSCIRNIEAAMGDGIKKPMYSELKIRDVVTKRIVAITDIRKGEIFSEENIGVKRNDIGEPAKNWDRVIGNKACHDYKKDQGIVVK